MLNVFQRFKGEKDYIWLGKIQKCFVKDFVKEDLKEECCGICFERWVDV